MVGVKKKIGVALVIGALIVWLVDRFTHIISTFLGKVYCGSDYMQPVDGVVGDMSCGFNFDMYLTVFLFIVFLTGIALFIKTKRKN